jgi:formylglycine-generating enzyme required for sulfatase activity
MRRAIFSAIPVVLLVAIAFLGSASGGRQVWIDSKPKTEKPRPAKPRKKPQAKPTKPVLDIAMILVPAGSFTMGWNQGQEDERPEHVVTFSQPFYLGKYEVTQAQWTAVMGTNPSYFKGDNRPVEQVSWNDVQEFLRRLNATTSGGYRLPTEAEWEYACRAGQADDSVLDLDTVAWFGDNSGDRPVHSDELWRDDEQGYGMRILANNGRTHSVGKKKPNAWGLYDMHGNVWELCQDWYAPYSGESQTDPTGPPMGPGRVSRGGCWLLTARYCRSMIRNWQRSDAAFNTLGLRLARNAQ